VDLVFDGECLDKQLAEFVCLTDLTCEQIDAYADDKLGHALCGATYTDFATSCTINQGVPGQECVAIWCADQPANRPSKTPTPALAPWTARASISSWRARHPPPAHSTISW
jgi:hypothetical protein